MPHEGRDSTDNRLHPRVGDADSLEGCVQGGVEEDVGDTEGSSEGIDQVPEGNSSAHSTHSTERRSMTRA